MDVVVFDDILDLLMGRLGDMYPLGFFVAREEGHGDTDEW
jgi:hypothetical protein